MPIELISDETFEPYAIKNYRNDFCFDMTEFHEDLRSIRYIKILINRYKNTGSLQERLILNHLITMGNIFNIDAVVKMLFFKLSEEDYPILKSFLLYLNFMPKVVYNIRGHNLWSSYIKEDINILQKLKRL